MALNYKIKNKELDFSRPKLMGILNLSPDSFYASSAKKSELEIFQHIEQLLNQGADIIDIGAYSSKPKAEFVSEELEMGRLIPIFKKIRSHFPHALFSIDTFRSKIADAALTEGADIINDISAGELDQNMFPVIAKHKATYCIMHMNGNPQNMHEYCEYKDLVQEVFNYFENKIKTLNALGVQNILIDPGFGFSKTLEQNYELLKNLSTLKKLNTPLLVGISRKSMIYKALHVTANEALNGTTVLNTFALANGANILRVHDVKEAREAIDLMQLFK